MDRPRTGVASRAALARICRVSRRGGPRRGGPGLGGLGLRRRSADPRLSSLATDGAVDRSVVGRTRDGDPAAVRSAVAGSGVDRILADNAVDIIVHLRGSEIVWISPSVEAALGGPAEQWIGADISRHFHPDDIPTLAAALTRVVEGGSSHHRFRLRSLDGDYHWVDGHGKPYVDADGHTDGLIGALRIVDDRVEVEQQLERLARFDALTGLANRGEAIARLEAALEHPQALGVHLGILFCDVDRFKDINDTWGHGVGDVVLATLAARIRECVRQGDTVGRTGGDEILVVLPGLRGIDQLRTISEKIRARAAEPINESGRQIHATLSIGATLAVPGETVSSVIARADTAMYQAKSGDRNTVVLAESGQPSGSTAGRSGSIR